MERRHKRPMKILYLLALAQLVGGPLVLLQVSLFCKLTLTQTPESGLADAARMAFESNEFKAALQIEPLRDGKNGKSDSTPQDPSKMEKPKSPLIAWADSALRHSQIGLPCLTGVHVDSWTPTWPHAPPGPPPRVG